MKIYSYTVVSDSGFSPNPYHGYLTLACCKPRIRSSAKEGAWIVGTASFSRFPKLGGYLLYAAEVSEVLSFEKYWNDKRFARKKPDLKRRNDPKWMHGDNIYDFSSPTGPVQLPSQHSHDDGSEDIKSKKHDLGGKHVIVARNFVYFGRNAIELPPSLKSLIKKGPGHKSRFDEKIIHSFLAFIGEHHKAGKGEILGDPLDADMSTSECRKCAELARREDGDKADDDT